MRLTFLGTGGGVPSPQRSLPSFTLNYERQILMFDCGEGTQLQMLKAKLGLSKKMKIFVTHLHGDHFFGMPGMLQTMSLLGRRNPVEIYGPEGIRKFLEAAKLHLQFKLRFPVEIKEIQKEGLICRDDKFKISAIWAEHSVPNLAYAFEEHDKPGRFYPEKALRLGVPKGPLWYRLQHGRKVKLKNGRIVLPGEVADKPRPGVKIVYSGDTKPCKSILKLTRHVDLLIHECTFEDTLAEKAEAEFHSTPKTVAMLAKKADVKRLILTHISARYTSAKILLNQAREIFPNVNVAEDLMQVDL